MPLTALETAPPLSRVTIDVQTLTFVGILILAAGLAGRLLARPRHGQPRQFVGTSLEVPLVLLIIRTMTVGVVLTVAGASSSSH